MNNCKKPEKLEMANGKQRKADKSFEKHMKKIKKHEKLDRNLGKDMKSSKKQMKCLRTMRWSSTMYSL